MTPEEFKAIRDQLGQSKVEFARTLGYTGNDKNNSQRMREFETGERPIPLYIARLAWLIGEIMTDVDQEPQDLWPNCVNDDGAIDWPDWSGVQEDT